MSALDTGVIGSSLKENEHRVPIHPAHLERIPEAVRSRMRFERGYGERFGLPDDELAASCGGLASRAELLLASDLVVLPKPQPEDLAGMKEGAVLWGWPHCVQQEEIAQTAIDRRLTLVAFEAMYHWTRSGRRDLHVFYKNNELAGYCAVLHLFELLGVDGHYGPRRRAVLLGFGSVSRGAAYALAGRGVSDLTVFTQRPAHLVRDQLFGARHLQMRREADGTMSAVEADGSARPLIDELASAEIIVNGTLQDTDAPLMYLGDGEEGRLTDGCLIVDVSCDLGMGFPFARPTTFEEPMFRVGTASYYAVDHTPSYLWDAASWEISEALLSYLPAVAAGPEGWEGEPTVARSIEIRDGVIQNPKILSFQGREAEYPHPVREAAATR